VNKYSIKDMHQHAITKGGKCLSREYKGAFKKLLWECTKGHRWEALPVNIIHKNSWCPICSAKERGKKRRLTIEQMQDIAGNNGGICLSPQYINIHTKLTWECSFGHHWEATPDSVIHGSWCPECARRKRSESNVITSIDEVIQIAEKRGGKCLSDQYVNSNTKLLFECADGHQWAATPKNIKKERWCRKCAGLEKLTIEEMQELAAKRGGKCLSKEYVNAYTELLWECSEGHTWKAKPTNIKSGKWCAICAGVKKHTLDEMAKLASERGGKCLSHEFVSVHDKMIWECSKGHIWEATPGHIMQGTWCPQCSTSLGERICTEYFNQLFGVEFKKSYPKWLKNSDGFQLELDGLNEQLGIAFEHQGLQHESFLSFFHKSEADFARIRRNDKIKEELCKQENILLIHVPEIPSKLAIENIKGFIAAELVKRNIPVPENFDQTTVSIQSVYKTTRLDDRLVEMQQIASSRGGRCLSEEYLTNSAKLLWECEKGHRWEAVASSVKMGTWCPQCGGSKKKTIEDMKRLAESRGGACLSEHYINSHIKLKWQCEKGHQWESIPTNIVSGKWCPECAGIVKLTIEDMHQIAKERQGRCLSEKYINARTKLLWECSEGHQWNAAPHSIKRGSWCPECARRTRIK
jgi:hypothetical protein